MAPANNAGIDQAPVGVMNKKGRHEPAFSRAGCGPRLVRQDNLVDHVDDAIAGDDVSRGHACIVDLHA